MGWVFIFLGLITLGIASFMIYYGQHLLTHPEEPAQVLVEMPILSPSQEHLLELLARYQKQFTVDKLVISREAGTLHFDNAPNKGAGIDMDLIMHKLGQQSISATKAYLGITQDEINDIERRINL